MIDEAGRIGPDELESAAVDLPPEPEPELVAVEESAAARDNAAAASAASVERARPRRPDGGSPQQEAADGEAPVDPHTRMVWALKAQFEADINTGRYTPVVANIRSLANVALREASHLPVVPPYDPLVSPRLRHFDRRVPTVDPEVYWTPDERTAGRMAPGVLPVGQSLAAARAGEVVEVAVCPAGTPDQDPVLTVELPLAAAQAFGLAVLAAAWAVEEPPPPPNE